jgi:hypothetical protein
VAEVAKYDDGEFPVLLRLPDILREHEAAIERPDEGERTDTEGSFKARSSPASSAGTRQRQHWPQEKTSLGGDSALWTAIASHRFWSAMAPRIAVGGMLLAVTALCVVLLQGSSGSNDSGGESTTQWASDPPLQSKPQSNARRSSDTRSDASPSPTAPWPSKPNSIAVKPSAGTPVQPGWGELDSGRMPTPALAPPMGTVPRTPPGAMGQWPGGGTAIPSSRGPTAHDPAQSPQVQGWPDELETHRDQRPAVAEPDLNSAAMSGMPMSFPRTSALPPRATPVSGYSSAAPGSTPSDPAWNVPPPPTRLPAWSGPPPSDQPAWGGPAPASLPSWNPPAAPATGGARLDGTVELPGYR